MKTERIHLRTTPDDKLFLQEMADAKYEGNLSALFDDMIKELKDKGADSNGGS